jgi:carbonic anhydrase/acetyltransferase-like protein (isoleucine patch superfamily)
MFYLRIIAAAFAALLPSRIQVAVLRTFCGYRIGRGVRIGFSLFIDIGHCTIDDGVRIGHGNVFVHIETLEIGEHSEIGCFNLVRGGLRVILGRFSTIRHLNVLNSIIDPDLSNPATPECLVGDGGVVTNNHWLDFTDRISVGAGSIIGGRSSSLWTHNRQRTRPITIGSHTYIGSNVSIAPGAFVGDCCVVALGAVLIDRYEEPRWLIAGNPAQPMRPLREQDLPLVSRRTRPDLPRELAMADVPEDLQALAEG